ncbi:MAG: hypothetical protein MUF23_13660 [Pirellula sp.]|nr:hypothetical protein [Pirellula sp.]
MKASEFYSQQLHDLKDVISNHEGRISQLQIGRGVTGIPGLLLILFGVFSPQAPWGTWQLGVGVMVAFLAIATWQENVRWRLEWHRQRRDFFLRLIARSQHHWSELKPLSSEFTTSDFHSELTKDLDLFGDRSLFRWLSLAATESGARRIAAWMTRWETAENLRERQKAVQSLAENRSWRLQLWDAAHAFRTGESKPESILAWAASDSYFSRYPGLKITSWISPCIAVLGCLLLLAGVSSGAAGVAVIGLLIALVGILVNLVITVGFIGKIHDIFVSIGGAHRELQAFSDLIRCAEQLDAPEPLLVRLCDPLRTPGGSAIDAIRSLRRRMSFAGLQRNPLFFIPYLGLQLLLLWDIRVLEWLEGWKEKHAEQVPHWIDAVAQLEALASAATIADENPEWGFPNWSSGLHRDLSVEQLAHPLVPEPIRVANDLKMEEARPLLLVTGSNMAGKSTLLRSLGINVVLSRVGAPVACRKWSSPNYDLASSIRVQDSLQDGVSFFMAELKRLKSVVDRAHEEHVEKGMPMLVLLDEILQGTNSRERQIAVQSVLQQLVQLGCTVVASTHDLDLAQNQFFTQTAQIVHFREFFETRDGVEVMRFDYKMRPGVTPTTNALKLLALVGLQQCDESPK